MVSTCIVAVPERVSADVSAQEAAQTFVQTVGDNRDFLIASAAAFWTYRQVQEAERATAEAERATAEAKRQAEEAFKQSDEYKVQLAVAKFMEPFVPKMPKRKVIHGKVMDTIANGVKTWDEHATIVSGRFQTGKTVAVEEVFRGARGIFKHTVKDEHWEEKLYKSLQVDGPGMFETVLVRVKAELAKLADPITKTPIILLEVPRTTTKGMDTISSTSKDLSTEGGKAAHAGVLAALAFDAGGANRQKDMWIDDLTAEEAKKVLTLHGHEENAQDIIDACGSRVGDLTESRKDMVAGKTLQELKQETEAAAEREVERFLNLEVEVAGGRVIPIGRNVLTKLANSKQRGGDGAAERSAGQGIVPKM
ncbi:unnamed protein product, partial [Symbiodinium pilosum]